MKKMGFQGPQTPYIEECTQTSPGAGKWHRAGVSLVFTVVTGSWTEEGPLEPPVSRLPRKQSRLQRHPALGAGFAAELRASWALHVNT